MYNQIGGCNVSFILKKIKKQNAYPYKLKKNQKCCRFIVINVQIKNICDVAEITKNPQNTS